MGTVKLELGTSPDQPGPFFSAEDVGQGEYQEHWIFRRDQWGAWKRMYGKQIGGQRVTKHDVEAIEPAATLILRVWEVGFDAKLLVNLDLVPRQEIETLIKVVGEAFLSPLDRDGKLLVYYTETPYNYEWS